MITKLGILNFQSIEQLAVECGPITVFVGESDSGKSAVVRALYAAAFNDYPSDHVRAGASDSTVVIATEAGTVQVEKGKGKNGYRLQPRGGAVQRWDRVGRDVPEEVAGFLGWRVVELDDGSKFAPSIQRQFDGPFLLADSPSRVAKVLGSLTNIATLFSAIREGTRLEREYRRAGDVAREESDRAASQIETLAPEVEAATERAETARLAQERAEAVVEQLVAVDRMAARLRESAGALVSAREALAAARERAARFEIPDLSVVMAEADRLGELLTGAREATLRVQRARADLEAARLDRDGRVAALGAFEDSMKVCPVCEREWHR